MLRRLKLGPKFTLILSVVFVAGIIVTGLVVWEALQSRAQAEMTSKAELLINAMNAVRKYTSANVDPLLADKLATQKSFISETVPAFSARQVFENFRKDKGHENFFYKEATLNPTNLHNKADDFEAELVARMRKEPELTGSSGFRMRDNEWVYYTARPLTVKSDTCLTCHGDPQQAPTSLLASYGTEHGFGWRLNEIVSTQILYVPAQDILDATRQAFLEVMAIVVGLLAVVLVLVNVLLARDVIAPIAVMAGLAQRISADEMVADDLKSAGLVRIANRFDELGQLASTFRQMAGDVYARTLHLKQEVQELRIEIDEAQRQRHVAQVVESDFFQSLQARSQALRSQRRSAEEEDAPADAPSEES